MVIAINVNRGRAGWHSRHCWVTGVQSIYLLLPFLFNQCTWCGCQFVVPGSSGSCTQHSAAPRKEPPNQAKALFHKPYEQTSSSYTDEAFQHYLYAYLTDITEMHQKTVSNFLLADKHLQ